MARWRDSDGDGIREKDGKEFRFTAIGASKYQDMAVYVQDQFRRVGVRMEIQTMDIRVVRQRQRPGKFDAVINRFRNLSRSMNWNWITRPFGENSSIDYKNPEIIRLINRMMVTIEPDERDRICREIMPFIQADIPVTFLLPKVQTHIAHRRIHGLSNIVRPHPVWFMEHLWIEEGK